MPVDSRALSSLELFKVLDYLAGFAVSEGGQRACLGLRPCADLEEIHRSCAAFEQGRLWLLNSETRLVPFPPLEGLLVHLAGNLPFLDLDDLWALRQVLGLARDIRESMVTPKDRRQWPLWVERCQGLAFPDQSVSGLNRCLSDEGMIKDQASPELSLVRGELRGLHRQCSGQVKNFAKEYNILHYLQDEYMTISSDRYVLPLKSNFKGRLQGIIHDYSQTGDTCYFEPLFLVELNNRLQDLKRQEREEERKVLMFLTSLVRQELPGVKDCYDFLLELDILQAKAALGHCYDGHVSEFDLDRPVNLVNARHPLLLLAVSGPAQKALATTRANAGIREGLENPPVVPLADADAGQTRSGRQTASRSALDAVPSDIILKSGQQALVISGGNAGGKTVCLKTLGIIALMGMCGLPVPVDRGSSLPFWTGIHAFIGDEQSLSDHVSTFTAQINHLAAIWERLGPSSLVILDEFGAGTDPSQGAALAQAVVDAIMDQGAYVAAATHFPALKAYALSNERVRAASVMFDPKTKKPLFKLIYDQVGASQALDVAREHGLPEEVLRRAEQYLLLSGEDTSALVDRLNSLAVEREKELEGLKAQQDNYRAKSKKQLEVFEREKKKLFEEVRADAAKVLDDWKSSRSGHKQTLKELSRVRNDLAKAGPGKEEGEPEQRKTVVIPVEDLFAGQKIRHLPWNKSGSILEIDARKNRVRLDLNGVSLWAGVEDLGYLDGQGKSPDASGKAARAVQADPLPVKGHTGSQVSPLPLRLDIRGMRADVAIAELARFLDSAVLTGREEIEVVHGRGTGVLRKEVHSYLKISPTTVTYRLGNEKEGGDGVTFVTLH